MKRLWNTPVWILILCLAVVFAATTSELSAQSQPPRKPAAGYSPAHFIEEGKKQLEQKRFALAVRSLSAAIRRDDKATEAYRLRGIAYDRMGKAQDAVRDFTRYLALKPGDVDGYVLRGDAQNFNLNHQAAVEDYSAAIKKDPSSTAAYIGRGLAYAAMDRHDDAIKDYHQALRLKPNHTETLANLGIACALAGRSMEAMTYLESALKTEKDPEWRAQIERWIARLLQGEKPAGRKESGPVRGPAGTGGRSLW